MRLLDSVMTFASSLMASSKGNGNLLKALAELVKNHPDGLTGLADQFCNGGLGDA